MCSASTSRRPRSSAPARRPARAEGLRNVAFEQADAQVHRFPPERFDLAVSRFATMFLDDPVAAFADLGRALRPAGRLVMTARRAPGPNAWDVAVRRSLEAATGPASRCLRGTGPVLVRRSGCRAGDPAGRRVRGRRVHRRPRTRRALPGRPTGGLIS
ncbi:class I SAM-dependent methyltransferase [Streptomyces sp. NPDC059355]|uniref:class I SAM-dependent methyltransferase n=1 Tax=Streptomyces sp. NPDC059355 TaxID=3346811 RepID=UPI0036B82BA1